MKPDSKGLEVNVILRPSMSMNGRVVGPDGQPIQDAWMISRACFHRSTSVMLQWSGQYPGSVKNGRFEIHRLDPDAEVPVYFLEPHHQARCGSQFLGQVGGRPVRSPSGSSPAESPGPGWSTPAASRSRGIVARA